MNPITQVIKENEEKAKDIAIVAHPGTRVSVERRALNVLKQSHLAILKAVLEAKPKDRKHKHEIPTSAVGRYGNNEPETPLERGMVDGFNQALKEWSDIIGDAVDNLEN